MSNVKREVDFVNTLRDLQIILYECVAVWALASQTPRARLAEEQSRIQEQRNVEEARRLARLNCGRASRSRAWSLEEFHSGWSPDQRKARQTTFTN